MQKRSERIGLVFLLSVVFLLTSPLGLSGVYAGSGGMTISLSSWASDRDPADKAWKQMAKDLEEATKGKVRLKIYYSQALGKAKEHYELALKGIADIGYMNVGFTPGRFPITDLASFAQAPTADAITDGMMALMKEGYMQREHEKVRLLYVFSGGPNQILWRKGVKAAKTLSDLKGKKIRVPTTAGADLMRSLGANPVAIPMPEVYTAMERGVIDGTFTTVETYIVFRLADVSDQITKMNSLAFTFNMFMNKSAWNKLPDEAKEVLNKNAYKYAMTSAGWHDKYDKMAVKKYNPAIFDLTPKELKKVKEIISENLAKYIKKYDAAGLPAGKAAQFYNQFLEKKDGIQPFILK